MKVVYDKCTFILHAYKNSRIIARLKKAGMVVEGNKSNLKQLFRY